MPLSMAALHGLDPVHRVRGFSPCVLKMSGSELSSENKVMRTEQTCSNITGHCCMKLLASTVPV
eukprot:4406143-Amphidinium_carterae.1